MEWIMQAVCAAESLFDGKTLQGWSIGVSRMVPSLAKSDLRSGRGVARAAPMNESPVLWQLAANPAKE
jgi:hypothetical protein